VEKNYGRCLPKKMLPQGNRLLGHEKNVAVKIRGQTKIGPVLNKSKEHYGSKTTNIRPRGMSSDCYSGFKRATLQHVPFVKFHELSCVPP